MSKEIQNAKKFYEVLDTLQVRGDDISKRRQELVKIVQNFETSFSEKIHKSKERSKGNKELQKYAESFIADSKNALESIKVKIDKKIEEERFSSQFKDKFIVIVYGKVNAGKSSLGNFIAKHCLPKQKADFKIYNKDNQNFSTIKEFEAKNTECTSEIQLFELGGLAWVDTPGLGSLTPENGALARKYIEAADYVVFPTASDSYMQSDEMTQLKELLKLKKHIYLLITKSDKSEEDEVNGKIVRIFKNKSLQDRRAQEKDSLERLKSQQNLSQDEVKLIDQKILSISVLAATKGLEENDDELLEQSNMHLFYENMQALLDKKAQRFKEQAPYESLDTLTTSIIKDKDSVQCIQESLANLKNKINEFKNNLEQEKITLRKKIEKLIRDNVAEKEIRDFKAFDKFIYEKVSTEVSKSLQVLFENFEQNFDIELQGINTAEYKIETRYKRVKLDKAWYREAWEWFGSWFGADYDEYETVPAGDNKKEVIAKFTNDCVELYSKKMLKENINSIKESFIQPLNAEFTTMQVETDVFYKKLTDFQKSLKK